MSDSPANPFGSDPQPFEPVQPQIVRPSSGGGGSSTLVIVLAAACFGFLICGGVLVALLLPAVQAAREAARRMQCSNNEKQIALALLNYESTYRSFPPAYTVDENGQPLHSWRTLILPYLEQQALYDRIDLTRPWNDPVNQPFNELNIATYQCPSTMLDPGMTTYVAIVDPQGVFSGPNPTAFKNITDGTSNTVLVVETTAAQAVHWMEPKDISRTMFPATGSSHTGGSNVVLCDGSVHFIAESIAPLSRDALVTKDGGEAIGF